MVLTLHASSMDMVKDMVTAMDMDMVMVTAMDIMTKIQRNHRKHVGRNSNKYSLQKIN